MSPGQMYLTPYYLKLVLQGPTTPGQFDMCRNPDVPRSNVPSPN